MEDTADPNDGLDGNGEEEQRTPFVRLDGFSGPLDHLLTLARAQKVDLSKVSLRALVDQLTASLRQAPATTSPGEKGDWVVMTAWLLQLRSLLLLPTEAPARQDAEVEADQLRARLIDLRMMQALAVWLEQRPQLGCDVLVRGQPEVFGVSVDAAPALDGVAFLWASLTLFDDDAAMAETAPLCRPCPFALYAVAEARARILRLLAETPEGAFLDRFLPGPLDHPPDHPADAEIQPALQRRSAWASTFVASLALAKQGDVALEQGGDFHPIHVAQV